MDFVCRYGEPDPFLKRDLDMKLELKMASVQYVHTQRFLSEVIAFAQHFLQLQEVLGRMRAASQGNEVGSFLWNYLSLVKSFRSGIVHSICIGALTFSFSDTSDRGCY